MCACFLRVLSWAWCRLRAGFIPGQLSQLFFNNVGDLLKSHLDPMCALLECAPDGLIPLHRFQRPEPRGLEGVTHVSCRPSQHTACKVTLCSKFIYCRGSVHIVQVFFAPCVRQLSEKEFDVLSCMLFFFATASLLVL